MQRRRARAYGIGGAAFLVAAVAAATIETVHERREMRAHAAAVTHGDPQRGEAMFIQYGCGSCHSLRHVRKATGAVGQSLDGVAVRAVLAGKLPNEPAAMQAWIRDPQAISPGTAMPDLNVGRRDAHDISAFLYTRAE